MFCSNCGREIQEEKKFCPACGAHAIGVKVQTVTQQAVQQMVMLQAGDATYSQTQEASGQMSLYDPNTARLRNIFVDPEERYLGEMGDGFIRGTLSSPFGVAKKCSAVVSDKRVYLKGKMIDASQGRLNACSWVKTVDVKDITGTGFVTSNPIGLLIIAILNFLMTFFIWIFGVSGVGHISFLISLGTLVLGSIFIIIYAVRRKVFFVVEYAGGRIQFDATLIGFTQVQAFQHLIIRAKDAAK